MKNEVLSGKRFEVFMDGYKEGAKDATSQLVGSATQYEEATPEEVNSQAYQKGYDAGVKFMYEKVESKFGSDIGMTTLYSRPDVEVERLIGVIDGVVEVEKLDSDSEDYYEGYVDGLRAAYEVYYLKKEGNCPVSSNCTCDRAAPCSDCDMLDEDDKVKHSDDYKQGYEDGYFKGECGFFEQFEEDPMVKTKCEVWDKLGEPISKEELDALAEADEEDEEHIWYDQGYAEGLVDGREIGFDSGFDAGYTEAGMYNVVLDGEILDEIYNLKTQILSYRKEPWSEHEEHNRMIFDLHHGLIELTETWVMNQVWKYWNRDSGDSNA